jgi:transposase
VQALTNFLAESTAKGDLATWRRAKAVLAYIQGKKVKVLSLELDVTRGSINRWLQWYDVSGVDGLRTRSAPGAAPRLNDAQKVELCAVIEAGSQAAGFTSGMWTGPMIGDWIREHFGVSYHSNHVPRLLHQLGFSVQRPRKRLARADAEAQAGWLSERLPEIKKKRPRRAA